jgi:ribonucleoside-diphosphate reductase alpha chain
VRDVFVVSSDVTPTEHVRMQAAFQAFVDNAISKTINMPASATEKDVADAYKLAWKLGCKGLTVYVTGSREKVVLETAETAKNKDDSEDADKKQLTLFNEQKKPRPRRLYGYTYKVETPLGTMFVTVNENGHGEGQPFEVFLNASKAGSETAAVSEAIGRLLSYVLRLSSPVSPRDRVKEIIRQLNGIGGGRELGFGAARVRSLADGVAQVLQQYLNESGDSEAENVIEAAPLPLELGEGERLPTGDICPECGEAALVNEEGCRKCYACGYSEC